MIHAGKSIDKVAMERLKKYLPNEIPTGVILGKVNLVDCIKITPEVKKELLNENKDIYKNAGYTEEYGWHVSDVEIFDIPIEAKGHLSLWEFDL